MGKSLKEKLNALPAARRKRILAEADRLYAEYLALQDLRKARKLTQTQLAEVLNIRQASVAQTEKRSDLMLSTLRSYVEAIGGRLNLMVEFADREPVSLEGFGDVGQPPKTQMAGRGSEWTSGQPG